MNTNFPIHERYFKIIYEIFEGKDQVIDHELASYLVREGYVLSQGRFGWALTNKGREFIRQYRYDRYFIEVIQANWPKDLIAVLRRCQFNSSPDIPEAKLKDLVYTGYLVKTNTGEFFLTKKAENLLIRYHE